MIPTCYLRQVPIEIIEGEGSYQTYRIDGYRLRQWWAHLGYTESPPEKTAKVSGAGEWRDIEIFTD